MYFLNSFGHSERKGLSKNSYTPGPGAYSIGTVRDTPAFTVRPRLKVDMMKDTPGPGTYNPNNLQETAPSWGLGRGAKDSFLSKSGRLIPGPGAYSVSGQGEGPRWGFGSSRRVAPKDNQVPGPGQYAPQQMTGNLPSYAKK